MNGPYQYHEHRHILKEVITCLLPSVTLLLKVLSGIWVIILVTKKQIKGHLHKLTVIHSSFSCFRSVCCSECCFFSIRIWFLCFFNFVEIHETKERLKAANFQYLPNLSNVNVLQNSTLSSICLPILMTCLLKGTEALLHWKLKNKEQIWCQAGKNLFK